MSASPIIEARREQMFPVLDEHDIARLKRFGEVRHYDAGAPVMKTGEIAPGLVLILAGKVQVSQGGGYSPRLDVVQHGPGSFMGELAQLSDRPSLVDSVAMEPVEALVVPPRRLRDVMVQEAELGERLMRALILRRVGLLEAGADRPDHHRPGRQRRRDAAGEFPDAATAIRTRRSIPRRRLLRPDPDRTLPVSRPSNCPSCCAPAAQIAAQSRRRRIGALHRAGAHDRSRHDL